MDCLPLWLAWGGTSKKNIPVWAHRGRGNLTILKRRLGDYASERRKRQVRRRLEKSRPHACRGVVSTYLSSLYLCRLRSWIRCRTSRNMARHPAGFLEPVRDLALRPLGASWCEKVPSDEQFSDNKEDSRVAFRSCPLWVSRH